MDDVVGSMSDDLKHLAQGPQSHARRFLAFNNGYKFQTLARENGLQTQNSRVFMTSTTNCVSNCQDANKEDIEIPYYRKLIDIIELNYNGRFMTLFRCMWPDTTTDRGFRKDA